jgi:hypothetical protein
LVHSGCGRKIVSSRGHHARGQIGRCSFLRENRRRPSSRHGLIIMPFFLLIAVIGAIAGSRATDRLSSAIVVVVALFLPVFYGVVGFVMGAFAGWVYNLVSKWIGGIELELQPPAMTAAATLPYSGD